MGPLLGVPPTPRHADARRSHARGPGSQGYPDALLREDQQRIVPALGLAPPPSCSQGPDPRASVGSHRWEPGRPRRAATARTREMYALSPDEARRVLQAAAGDRFEALYVLAITTGMRQGELL